MADSRSVGACGVRTWPTKSKTSIPTIAAIVRAHTQKGTSKADTSGDSAAHEAPRCRTRGLSRPLTAEVASGAGGPWGPRTDDTAARGYSPPRNRRRRPPLWGRHRAGYFPHDTTGMRGVPRMRMNSSGRDVDHRPPSTAAPARAAPSRVLPRAREGWGGRVLPRRGGRGPPSGVRGVELAQLLLQLGQLVAQPGGHLELQLAGGGQHLVVHLREEVGQLGSWQALDVDAAGLARLLRRQPWHRRLAAGLLPARAADQLDVLGVLRGAVDAVEDVDDLLAQRLRVDAALGVVRDLLLAPPVGLLDRLRHGGRDRVGVHVHLEI